MNVSTLPFSLQLPLNHISHLFPGMPFFGEASVQNVTLSITSNAPAASTATTFRASQLMANILPSGRVAVAAFTGALMAEFTSQLPLNVARYLLCTANLLPVLQKAYEIVIKWPTFLSASPAEKAKMIATEAVPIAVAVTAALYVGEPGKMLGYIIIPPILDYLLNHISPNSTDTRELTITLPTQMSLKFTGYVFFFVILPAPIDNPLFVIPYKKAAAELFFRSLVTLTDCMNKPLLDDPKKIMIPTLSATRGNAEYEIACLLSTIIASISVNDLLFLCARLTKSTGDFAPPINNTVAVVMNISNGTIGPSMFGFMSRTFGLPESKTLTAEEIITFDYEEGNKRIISSYDVNPVNGLAATMPLGFTEVPKLLSESEVKLTRVISHV